LDRVFVFLIGLALGSAANVIAGRFGSKRSFLSGRSVCDHCGRPLTSWQLVPLVGFLVQAGRCVFCGKPIALRYTIVELLTALAALLIYREFDLAFVTNLLLVASLIAASLIDLDKLILPDWLLAVASILAVVTIVVGGAHLGSQLVGAALGFIVPGLLVLPSRGRLMGYGDVKLGALIGLWLGFPAVITAFWLAFVSGGLVALLLLWSGRKQPKDQLAFGPFLVLGSIVAYRFSTQLISYVWF